MKYLILDYETRSEAELREVGAYEYARHPSTQILCASWRIGTREELREQLTNKTPAKIWSPAFFSESDPISYLIDGLTDDEQSIIAHNAFFEQCITRFVMGRAGYFKTLGKLNAGCTYIEEIPHDRWICTASMARALALPGNLEGACSALKLPIQKDMDGRRLMLKLCKPRKPSKNNPSKWHQSARDLRRIMQYCQNDVDAETLLFLSLPELNETERQVWLLDQKINFRGFECDRDMVNKVLKLIHEETTNLNKETWKITDGEIDTTNRRAAVIKWLERQGTHLPDLRAGTVSDAITTGLVKGKAKRLLEIRQAISKTSTAKYEAFEQRSRSDGRVRDNLVYHTASTGRWGGSGVQPQNLPRPSLSADEIEIAIEVIRGSDA